MCTALLLRNKNKHYFGRNMDIETFFGQQVVITPRNYEWEMKFNKHFKQKYSTIGMAMIFNDPKKQKEYPLYAEAANEVGLAVAGLNFPSTAHYIKPNSIPNSFQITPYELIPWILANFSTVKEVEDFFNNNNVQIVNEPISPDLPIAPLHFMIGDKNDDSIVIEPCVDGLKVYKNKIGVLTNNPTFDWQLINLSFYQNLTSKQRDSTTWADYTFKPYGQGFASFGLPGDWTPPSRFVRTAFLKATTPELELNDIELLSQFFHILDNVAMVRGSITVQHKDTEKFDITLYTSCIDLDDSIYYYKNYFNNQITAISMKNEDLDGTNLIKFGFILDQKINYININK